MEISRVLRLDRPGSDGRVSIHFRICWDSQKVRLSSGEKILPDEWDNNKNRVRGKVKFSAEINGRLDTYENGLMRFFHKRPEGVLLTADMVRAEVARIRSEELGKKVKTSLIAPPPLIPSLPTPAEFVEQYLAERKADRSKSWRVSMKIVGGHLSAFRPGLQWSDLKLSTLNMFKVYLIEELELSDATLETYVGLLSGMLDYAGRSGMPVLPDYNWIEVRRVGDALQPELKAKEIRSLQNVTLLKPTDYPEYTRMPRQRDCMEQTRWYFLIACNTGLRHSDLWQVINPKISTIENTPCLEVYQQKTKNWVHIPLDDDTYHLIRNPINKNKPLGSKYYNGLLKPIARQAELNRIVTVGSHYNGKLVADQLELYQTVSSHMARRTFATLMTQGGMATRTLQELMGHASIASTQRYAKVSNETIISQTLIARQKINLIQ